MKWSNHRTITTSLATLGALWVVPFPTPPAIIAGIVGVYIGSTLPDKAERHRTKEELTFHNHRQITHYLLPYACLLFLFLYALHTIAPYPLLSYDSIGYGESILPTLFFQMGMTYMSGIWAGAIAHILEDALTGSVPHPLWGCKQRVGKAILPVPYEYLLSSIFLTMAGISLFHKLQSVIL